MRHKSHQSLNFTLPKYLQLLNGITLKVSKIRHKEKAAEDKIRDADITNEEIFTRAEKESNAAKEKLLITKQKRISAAAEEPQGDKVRNHNRVACEYFSKFLAVACEEYGAWLTGVYLNFIIWKRMTLG